MSKYVLDASALLALLNQEKGKERVEALLPDSIISAANFCEALGKLIDAGMNETDARESIGLLNIRVISFNEEMARLAAGLRPKTRKLGLSLGDRSCLALGLVQGSTVITAERAWVKLNIGVKVDLIR